MAAKPLIPHLKEKIKVLETSLEDQLSKNRNLEAKSEKAQNQLDIKEEFCHEFVSVLKDGGQVLTMAAKPLILHLKERIKVLEENSKTLEMILEDELSKNRNLEAELEKAQNQLDINKEFCPLQVVTMAAKPLIPHLKKRIKVLEEKLETSLKEFCHELVSVLKDGGQEGQSNVAEIARGDFNTRQKKALEFIESGNIEMLKILVGFGLDVNAKCVGLYNGTFLHHGAELGNLDVVKTLCRLGAKVNSQNKKGETPLHRAARNGHVNVCEYLIKSGAKIDACDSNKHTPLHLAAWNGHVNVCEYFITCGAQIDACNGGKDRPLVWAAWNGHVCEYLIKSEAQVDACDCHKVTPLHLAARKGHVNVCEYLIKSGAQVQAYDSDGYIPYHWAVGRGHLDVMKCFVQHGVRRNIKTQSGYTSHGLAESQSVKDYIYNNGRY